MNTRTLSATAKRVNLWLRGQLMRLHTDPSAHPCPVCGRIATGYAWQYATVCDTCSLKVVCPHARRVDGHNTSPSGGFIGVHADDGSTCEDVTRNGAVWIDGVECHMGEAKFGGVFIGTAPTGSR